MDLGGEGELESVTFIGPMELVIARRGPADDPAAGRVVVVDISNPGEPVVRLELEAYWGEVGQQVLGYPSRPSTFFVNEELGIGVVDLSRCP